MFISSITSQLPAILSLLFKNHSISATHPLFHQILARKNEFLFIISIIIRMVNIFYNVWNYQYIQYYYCCWFITLKVVKSRYFDSQIDPKLCLLCPHFWSVNNSVVHLFYMFFFKVSTVGLLKYSWFVFFSHKAGRFISYIMQNN